MLSAQRNALERFIGDLDRLFPLFTEGDTCMLRTVLHLQGKLYSLFFQVTKGREKVLSAKFYSFTAPAFSDERSKYSVVFIYKSQQQTLLA